MAQPHEPTGFAVDLENGNSISLIWDKYTPSSGITDYTLFYGTTQYNSNNPSSHNKNSQGTNINSLTQGTTYYFYLQANLTGFPSSTRAEAIGIPGRPPAPVTNFVVTVQTFNSIVVEWDAYTADMTDFHLYYGLTPGNTDNFTNINKNQTTHTINSLTESTIYYISLIVIKNQHLPSSPALITSNTLTEQPSALIITSITATVINLAFTAPSIIPDNYNLYTSLTDGVFTTYVTIPNTETTYSSTDLTPSTHYYYKLEANKNTIISAPLYIDDTTMVEPPTNLNVFIDLVNPVNIYSTITLTWTAPVSVINNYILYWGTEPGVYTSSVPIASDITRWDLTSLTYNTVYYVALVSVLGVESEPAVGSASSGAVPDPLNPELASLTNTQMTFTVTDSPQPPDGLPIESVDIYLTQDPLDYGTVYQTNAWFNSQIVDADFSDPGVHWYIKIIYKYTNIIDTYYSVNPGYLDFIVPLSAPTYLTADTINLGEANFTWVWPNPIEPDTYNIYLTDVENDWGVPVASVPYSTTSYLTVLNQATHYWVRVTAVKNGFEGSPADLAFDSSYQAPQNLVNNPAFSNLTELGFDWEAYDPDYVPDTYSYTLQTTSGFDPEAPVGSFSGTNTSYIFDGLTTNTTYYLYLWAIRNSIASAKSEASANTNVPPPYGLDIVLNGATTSNLSWLYSGDGQPDNYRYWLTQTQNEWGPGYPYVELAGDIVTADLTGLTPGTFYWFYLVAVVNGYESVLSLGFGEPKWSTQPYPVENVTSTVTATTITLNWTIQVAPERYDFYLGVDVVQISGNVLTYTYTNLSPLTEYQINMFSVVNDIYPTYSPYANNGPYVVSTSDIVSGTLISNAYYLKALTYTFVQPMSKPTQSRFIQRKRY